MSKTKKIVFTVLLGALVVLGVYLLYYTASNVIYSIRDYKIISSEKNFLLSQDSRRFTQGVVIKHFLLFLYVLITFILTVFLTVFLWKKEISFVKYSYNDYKLQQEEKIKAKLGEKIDNLEKEKSRIENKLKQKEKI